MPNFSQNTVHKLFREGALKMRGTPMREVRSYQAHDQGKGGVTWSSAVAKADVQIDCKA